MTRALLVAGGDESLIYTMVTGRVRAFVPFTSPEDVEFYWFLEDCLQAEVPRPTGRDPQENRVYYAPTKHAVDGNLCNAYGQLPYNAKQKIAEKLEQSVGEMMKKLKDTRYALL